MKFKKGSYYIGDPCFLFNRRSWLEILRQTDFFEKEDSTIDNLKVAVKGTIHGDGDYQDNYGRKYGVDAGLIGILPIALIEKDNEYTKEQIEESDFMHIVKFEQDFEVEVSPGHFQFGDIIIDTVSEDKEIEDDNDHSCDWFF
jgi:hypothetical protein